MNSQSVDLIATDPPFNKGRDFHATPDSLAQGARFHDRWSWEADVHQEWLDQLEDDHSAAWAVIDGSRRTYGNDMGAFLCFMAVRLIEMHRLLKDTGSLYLHCDPTASHYLKTLLDVIFGRKNFMNEVVWHYTGGGRSKTYFSRKHDLLFLYSKSVHYTFNLDAIRVPYKETSGYAKGGIVSKSGKHYTPHPDGTPVDDVWDIPIINPLANERCGYPTQKPLTLYERIIQASSNEGDIVLDPFCGCATTLVAAEKHDRQWVGIDIWEQAERVVLERMKSEWLTQENDGYTLLDETIHFLDEPPERTDDGEEAVLFLESLTSYQIPKEPWQKLLNKEITDHLIDAQGNADNLVVCAGCGRRLEKEFMQLDHINPRSGGGANDISNRILLCGPCNLKKSNKYTLIGLRGNIKTSGWMHDEKAAKLAEKRAHQKYQQIVVESRIS